MGFEHELRLAYAVAINAFVFACAYRFVAARVGGDVVQRLIDTFLLYYAVQYCSIMLPGLLGALHPFSIAAVAAWLGVSLLTGAHFLPLPRGGEGRGEGEARGLSSGANPHNERLSTPPLPPHPNPPTHHFVVTSRGGEGTMMLACALFVLAFIGALVHQQRYLPPFATDALTYHLPAAVQWLQTGWTGVFETWFFNPANTYSPLGGSTFIAWLLSPTSNHVLARFVQVGPLLMLFFLLIETGRALGASTSVASIIAAGAVLSRPFISQAIVPKDDLFVVAFAVAGLLALCGPRAGDRWSPWRAGGAIGLLLAMKYTVLFAAPILLLAIDAPIRRWRLRGWLIALGIVILLAGVWYARNWWLTGNPLFPMDIWIGGWHVARGMFATARSDDLQTWAGVGGVLFGGYYSVPPLLGGLIAASWILFIARLGQASFRKPLPRACLFGSLLSLAAFLIAAPFGEIRFLYPAIALLMACAGGAITLWTKRPILGYLFAATFFIVALLTCGFPTQDKITFTIVGAVAAAAGVIAALALQRQRRLARRALAVIGVSAGLIAVGFTYVSWRAYLDQLVVDEHYAWANGYGPIADAWAFVRREIPPDATVAYANTFFVYPLQGDRLTRRAVYAPVRPGVERIADLPRLPGRVSGERIVPLTVRETVAGADRDTWLENLGETGAGYLFVAKGGDTRAPELEFAAGAPSRFTRVFENEAATIYRIDASGGPATRPVE